MLHPQRRHRIDPLPIGQKSDFCSLAVVETPIGALHGRQASSELDWGTLLSQPGGN